MCLRTLSHRGGDSYGRAVAIGSIKGRLDEENMTIKNHPVTCLKLIHASNLNLAHW